MAIDSVIKKLGGLPRSIRLGGYKTVSHFEYVDGDEIGEIQQIDGEIDPAFLGFSIHVFQIESEKRTFRVFVSGCDVEVVEISD